MVTTIDLDRGATLRCTTDDTNPDAEARYELELTADGTGCEGSHPLSLPEIYTLVAKAPETWSREARRIVWRRRRIQAHDDRAG